MMVRKQMMKYVMTVTHHLMMDATQTDQQLKTHGYALEAIKQQKINVNTVTRQLVGIQTMKQILNCE